MSLAQVIDRVNHKTLSKTFRENKWGERHVLAWRAPLGMESPIIDLFRGLAYYADAHKARYESKIGDDGVLGKEWLAIARALRGLLNGDLGRLDGGTLDGLLYDMVEDAGFSRNELED